MSALTTTQEGMLIALVNFLESKLLHFSHEKRGVALHVTSALLRIVPPEHFPMVLTKPLIRLALAARANKKHTLHEFVVGSILSWKEAAGNPFLFFAWFIQYYSEDRISCRLALASVLVKHGSPNFDTLTGTSVVSDLLQGLDKDSIVCHMKFLCNIVGGSGDVAEDTEDSMADSALEALVLLAKNNKLELRNCIAVLVIGVLIRLSCFGAARNKKKTKSKLSSEDLPEDASVILTGFFEELDKLGDQVERLREMASTKLLSLLSDIGFLHYDKSLAEEKSQAPVFLDYAATILQRLSLSHSLLRAGEAELATMIPFQTLHSISGAETSNYRITSAAKNAVTFTMIHVFCKDELDLQVNRGFGSI